MAIPSIPDLRTLMESGVHFGHASGKWHPKMRPYIFATRDKLHIIDLEKTQEKLVETLTLLEDRIKQGKTIVLVGTKKQVSDRIKEIGERHTMPYINVRWPGGVMTNFAEMQKSINRMKKLTEFLASEEAEKTIKKERVRMESDLRRMQYKFGGLTNMNKKPDALFVIDPGHEHNAIKEARHQGIEIFGVIDTNSNPADVDHLIPANDDGPKSLTLILGLIEETIISGQKLREQYLADESKKAEPKAVAQTEEVTTTEEANVVEQEA